MNDELKEKLENIILFTIVLLILISILTMAIINIIYEKALMIIQMLILGFLGYFTNSKKMVE